MRTEVKVDLRVYSLLTVRRAAAAMSAQYWAAVTPLDDTHVLVTLRARFDELPTDEVISDFLALLIDLALQDNAAGVVTAA